MDNEYWNKRSADAIGRMESAVNGAIPDLLSAFESARRDLNDQIERFYVRYATNNKISLADAQKRLSLAELRDFKGDLKTYEALAKNSIGTFNLEVDNLSVQARITRLEALQTQCDAILQKLYQEQARQINDTATGIYSDAYYHQLFDIEQYTGFHFPFSKPAVSGVQSVIQQPVYGMDISEHLWRQDIDTGFRIRQTLNNMFVTGRPPQYFSDELQKAIGAVRVDKSGTITGTGKKFEAYRLLYNESAHCVNQAQLQAYRDDGVEEYECIETLDRKTCAECQDMDGQHFQVSKAVEGVNHPSFHVFCRGTTAPYFADLQKFVTERAARDPVTGKTEETTAKTYDEWKKQQEATLAPGKKEYDALNGAGIKRLPDIDTFQQQRYNNSPAYQAIMQRHKNLTSPETWQAVEFNPETVSSHFKQHGQAVGAADAKEYSALSVKFVNEAAGKDTVIDSDGIRRFFSSATNEFAAVYPDGTISTYFKPRHGIKYWKGQVDKYGPEKE